MGFPSDIEIAQSTNMLPISEVAAKLGLGEDALEYYGKYKAKIDLRALPASGKMGRLILVTAMNPTPAGEGKTTTSVGLSDALTRIGKKTVLTLREPSLGPVFGIKGGAAGGGYSQVVPMEDINLHFTGDFHAVGAANNLLAAMLDNHIHQGNELDIDTRRITWRRAVDMNDRQLRSIVSGLGGPANGIAREDGYDIVVASEVMAVLCLAADISDLKSRLGRIVVASARSGKPVTARDLKADGAMAALLKDAIKPNLVQTLEHTPAIIHGGPFANIAHGCNSVIATKTALGLADYVVTEAGFGADLGAEKFLDIKCRTAGLSPDAAVIVATVRGLKHHGSAKKEEYSTENLEALGRGLPNLIKHVENLTNVFNLPAVVAINRFNTDTDAEIELIRAKCAENGVRVVISEVWEKGGAGGLELAREVVRLAEEKKSGYRPAYELSLPLRDKIMAITQKVYGGRGIVYTKEADKELSRLEGLGYGHLPVCMAKTQYSLSDDPAMLGRPEDFDITIKKVKLAAGAGFVVVQTGEIMTMPGLPKSPAAERIDVDEDGVISGLF
ncbi:MAG: formate--tetrahydrofolate ligase [Oscillospiraceae bacterium]|jgi:formate--tetrahydrofolate ligase